MVQGYYTLEEAAQILKMATEELTQMAQKRQIRAFADRGTWRFRAQDVEELARRRGQASDEVDTLAGAHGAGQTQKQADVFNFDLAGPSDSVDVDLAASPAAAKPGSDSDVKLVLDSDSAEVEVGGKAAKAGNEGNKKTHVPEAPADSEAQLIPLDEPDALVLSDPIGLTASDSDIRLEEAPGKSAKRPEDMPRTEEVHIDLDKELLKSDDARKKPRTKSASPFELSDSNLELPKHTKGAGSRKSVEESSDPEFDLSPTTGSSDEISLSEIELQDDKPSNPKGINLSKPADSGIKLAKDSSSPSSSDEIEFELSLDSDSDVPAARQEEESSSSEFELTLDDSGGLAPLEEKAPDSGETDIFETDLEVPALDEESGSEVVPIDESDTDLESSDFDFDPESAESGSQVVALDDEADDAAATVARKSPARGRAPVAEEDSGVAEVDEILTDSAEPESPMSDLADDELAEPVATRKLAPVAAAPSNWGVLPAIIMLPCVLVMTLLVIMAFELLHDMWGYKQSFKPTGVLIRPITQMFSELPPDQ